MDEAFWQERWRTQQIGFHEGKPNELLAAHVDRFGRGTRVLVPLAGKAIDLRWLAERGHSVVGVELVADAIAAFHREQGEVAGLKLVQADIFATPELGLFDIIYDRAALVALAPSDRERYVDTCRAKLKPGGAIFLIAFAYDQTKAPGPPWSVDETTVRKLYGEKVEVLARRSLPTSPRLRDAGVETLEEAAYFIR